MDKNSFPELEQTSDLELLRTRKELAELKAKLAQYEQVLKDNDLLDAAPVISDAESICVRELQRYNELSQKGTGLTLEDTKIVDLLVKNLMLVRGKAVPVEDTKKKSKKTEQIDIGKLIQIAGAKDE